MLPHFTVYAEIKDWGSCVVDGVPTFKCFEVVLGNLLFMSSAFIILVLFIMILVGGFSYLTSFGNPEKVKKAQGTLKYALFGFLLFVGSYLILRIVQVLFLQGGGADLFKFQLP